MPALARDVVGTVVNASERGLLVKAPQMVPIGTPLVDVRNQPVGRVVDVIGPVKAPYLIVKPSKGASPQRLLSREVYRP
jgi:rRNA processing protein Gar1